MIATALNKGIQEAAGPLQVCTWHLLGCEAAVHAMHQVFQSPNTEGVILVDTSLNWETEHLTSLSSSHKNPI